MKTLTTTAVGALLLVAFASPSQADDSGLVRGRRSSVLNKQAMSSATRRTRQPAAVSPGRRSTAVPSSTSARALLISKCGGSFSPAAMRSARRMGSLTS
jgi:hypothetical protein